MDTEQNVNPNGSGGESAAEATVERPQGAEGGADAAPSAPSAEPAEDPKQKAWVDSILAKANRATADANAEALGEEGAGAGGEDDGEQASDAEDAADGAEAATTTEDGAVEKPRRSLKDLNAEHRARIETKRREKVEARLQRVIAVLEGLQAGVAPPEGAAIEAATSASAIQPAAEEEPEPDFDLDPKAWYTWKLDHLQRGFEERERHFQGQLVEQLSPLIEGGRVQQEQATQEQAAMQHVARERAFNGEAARLAGEYRETIEGHGFAERLTAYAGYFMGALTSQGASEQEAKAAFEAEARRILVEGEQEGHHPMAYYDEHIIRMARAAEGLPTAVRPTAAPAAAAPAQPAPRTTTRGSRQRKAESDLAAAAVAANLPEARAGRDRDAVSAGPSAVDIGAMAKRGAVTGDMILGVAAATKRNALDVVREALRAASG